MEEFFFLMITFTGPEFEYSVRVDNGRGPLIGRVKYKLHDSIDYIEGVIDSTESSFRTGEYIAFHMLYITHVEPLKKEKGRLED